MNVTVIGLGAMGGAVGERLIAQGFETAVYDVNPAAVDRLTALGARAINIDTATPEQLGDFVVTSLPNDQILKDVALSTALLDHMAGRLLVELSTTLPGTIQDIARVAAGKNVRVVDSPVSGGPAEAVAGTLTLMVGASDSALADARPLLEAIGSVEHVGDVGQGKAVKLVNNLMAMGNVAVAAEAFKLGTALGIDGQRLYEVLNRSGGRSFHFTKRMPWALEDDYRARFALSLGEKDMRLGLQLAHEAAYVMPIASAVHQVFEMGRADGLGTLDVIALCKVYDGWVRSRQS